MSNSVLEQALREVSDSYGLELSVTRYSGRGMFGKQCLAVSWNKRYDVCPFRLGVLIGQWAHDNDASTFDDLSLHSSEDSMGLGTVMYWPNVPAPDADDDDEAEDAA